MESKEKGNLIYDFDVIKVRTRTLKALTNLKIDIHKLFNELPIREYYIAPKKRGRKKKEEKKEEPNEVDHGDIITLELEDKLRGVLLKKKKKKNSGEEYFRNSLTIVMMVKDKFINFKVSNNGKFQITGCKNDEHAEDTIRCFVNHIKNIPSIDEFSNINKIDFFAVLVNVMTNIDFDLGFEVNRENLDKWIYNNTEYNSLLETSFGYTGVNIKLPLKVPSDHTVIKISLDNGEWKKEMINYHTQYLSLLENKERNKEVKKERYSTFLVFHTGNVIMSSMNKEFMKSYFYDFINMIKECRENIEEKAFEIKK